MTVSPGRSHLRGSRRFAAACAAVMLAAALSTPPAARAQEKTVTLSFTKELLYNIARDNDEEMTKDLVKRLKGLSPAVSDARIIRSGADITLAYLVQAGEDMDVAFNLTLEKMAFYRMAAARADIDGMLKILAPAKEREPLILKVAYRYNEHYSIVDITLDLRPVIKAQEEEMRRAAAAMAPPPTKPVKAAPAKPPADKKPPPPPEKKEPKKKKAPEKKAEPVKKKEKKPPPPTEKKEPTHLLAVPLGGSSPPEIDGLAKEKSWKNAEPFRIGVKGASGRFDVTISALWGDGTVYFLVRWPDKDAGVEHHPWQWSEETGEYLVGKAVEDALALQFSREGKLGDCMLSGRPVEADLWYWRAARTNPAGFADDETLTVSTKRIPKANFYQASNKMTVWVKEKRDAGTSPYRSQVAGTFEGEMVRRYVPRTPAKSAADVRARGTWDEGTWTVEFARKLDTGDPVDVVFAPGKDRYFSLAVFNGRERSEHSTSGETLVRLK